MDNEKVQYLPFHAINNFMLPDYRLKVLSTVLGGLDRLSAGRRGTINSLLKRLLQVPGFRNGALAPLPVKIKGTVTPFERNPEVVAQVIAGWVELHSELQQQVYDLLTERGWEILPVETDRTKLPGFLTQWPKAETFEAINAAFHEKYPGSDTADNDSSLMTVWLSGRLPYDVDESEEEE